MFKSLKVTFLAAVAATLAAGGAVAQQNPDFTLSPSYGVVRLHTGFQPEPYVRQGIEAGGQIYIEEAFGCPNRGWFAARPDLILIWGPNSGSFTRLSIAVHAPGDTMLLVLDPRERWNCNDNYGDRDPLIIFDPAASGEYYIWVGTYEGRNIRDATIFILER